MQRLRKTLGTWEVTVAGVALVVAASTLVSDFAGYFALGGGFAIALLGGFLINLLLGLSAADLAVAYPRAGALYAYARAVVGGGPGRLVGTFLGLAFYGMFAFAISGETAAGAFGLQALLGSDWPLGVFIVALSVLAVIPNVFGLRTTAWVSAGLLVLMLGIRWAFGLAGFLGLGRTGAWSAAYLSAGAGGVPLFGERGVLTAGLALAFWSFVGIEFVCSLAEEVKVPRRALPRGILLGLVGILATSLVMGLGVIGTAPLPTWQAAAAGAAGCGGACPQLAAGTLLFGPAGRALMALASAAATLGTLTVAYAAMPRLIYSMARDGLFLGPLSPAIGTLHPRFGTPVPAMLLTLALYLGPALSSGAVIEWLYSAAYVWALLYVAFHGLALLNRRLHPHAPQAFAGRWFAPMAMAGAGLTVGGLAVAFAGAHWAYGSRAFFIFAIALVAATLSTQGAPVRDELSAEPLREEPPTDAGGHAPFRPPSPSQGDGRGSKALPR